MPKIPTGEVMADPARRQQVEQTLRRVLMRPWMVYADVVKRDLVCTPYGGGHGLAGWVVCLNGSPPRGTLVIETTTPGGGGHTEHVTLMNRGRPRAHRPGTKLWNAADAFYDEFLKGQSRAFTLRGAGEDDGPPVRSLAWGMAASGETLPPPPEMQVFEQPPRSGRYFWRVTYTDHVVTSAAWFWTTADADRAMCEHLAG